MAKFEFDTTNVPLAIVRRVEELNKKLSRADDMDNHDEGEINQLRARIDAVKSRITARQAEFDEFNKERDALAFAVKAYQGNWTEPSEDFVIERVAELAEPTPEPVTADPLPTLKERVYNAIAGSTKPLGGSAIAKVIGADSPRIVAPILGTLRKQHRIQPIYTEGEKRPKWMVARA